jgi:hypothetical protein
MTPFWWAYSPYLNNNVVSPSMMHFARFVSDIDFARLDPTPVALTLTNGDGWAMRTPQFTFGWAVNPLFGIAGESITVPGLPDGEYDVLFYRTWRGLYLEPVRATSTAGALTVQVPVLKPVATRAQNIGNDVAFKITPRPRAAP